MGFSEDIESLSSGGLLAMYVTNAETGLALTPHPPPGGQAGSGLVSLLGLSPPVRRVCWAVPACSTSLLPAGRRPQAGASTLGIGRREPAGHVEIVPVPALVLGHSCGGKKRNHVCVGRGGGEGVEPGHARFPALGAQPVEPFTLSWKDWEAAFL